MIIGIGIDCVDIERIATWLKRFSKKKLERVFTPLEINYCLHKVNPASSLATRFAVKEAVAKALGCGIGKYCSCQEVETTIDQLGKPNIELHGNAYATSQQLDISHWHLSMTHSLYTATAYVIAEKIV